MPISPTAIVGAVRVAGRLAGEVRDAISFDDLLNQKDPAGADKPASTAEGVEPPSAVAELLRQTVDAIRDKLSSAGLSANQPLAMRIDQDTELRMVGDHPQAAAIEMLLARDPDVQSKVTRLHQAGGPQTLSIPQIGPASVPRNISPGPS